MKPIDIRNMFSIIERAVSRFFFVFVVAIVRNPAAKTTIEQLTKIISATICSFFEL
jgi:hypothetical protein